jgi:hypothetical protein
MTYIPTSLRRAVWERADGCCEYCLIESNDEFLSHEVDHIIAEKHHGQTDLENLCLSCFDCNRFKGSDISSVDEETGEVVILFHPRRHRWVEHFQIVEALIEPLTPQARVTASLLRFNSEEQITKRQELIKLKRYPCRLT